MSACCHTVVRMAQDYVQIRLPTDLHAKLKERAAACDRSMIWLIRKWLEKDADYQNCEEAALVLASEKQVKEAYRQNPSGVSPRAREIVFGCVPRHLLSNRGTRTGLDQQVQQMIDDGCDQRGIAMALEEWVNRPDAYPGHLPHIYNELLRQRMARPKSKPAVDNVRGWLELGKQMQAEHDRSRQ